MAETETKPKDPRSWDAWHGVHQRFEIDWWRKQLEEHPDHVADPGFTQFWTEVR